MTLTAWIRFIAALACMPFVIAVVLTMEVYYRVRLIGKKDFVMTDGGSVYVFRPLTTRALGVIGDEMRVTKFLSAHGHLVVVWKEYKLKGYLKIKTP